MFVVQAEMGIDNIDIVRDGYPCMRLEGHAY